MDVTVNPSLWDDFYFSQEGKPSIDKILAGSINVHIYRNPIKVSNDWYSVKEILSYIFVYDGIMEGTQFSPRINNQRTHFPM